MELKEKDIKIFMICFIPLDDRIYLTFKEVDTASSKSHLSS